MPTLEQKVFLLRNNFLCFDNIFGGHRHDVTMNFTLNRFSNGTFKMTTTQISMRLNKMQTY